MEDEKLLNMISEELFGISLVIDKRGLRDDNLRVFIPRKWLMGSLGYEQDNKYYFYDKSDNFNIKIYVPDVETELAYTKDDIVLSSDSKESITEKLDNIDNSLDEIEDMKSSVSPVSAEMKLKKIEELKKEKEKIKQRKSLLKFKNIKYNPENDLFELSHKIEIDSIDDRKIAIELIHKDQNFTIMLSQVKNEKGFLDEHKYVRWAVHPIWGYLSKDEIVFLPETVYFNEKSYKVVSNELIDENIQGSKQVEKNSDKKWDTTEETASNEEITNTMKLACQYAFHGNDK